MCFHQMTRGVSFPADECARSLAAPAGPIRPNWQFIREEVTRARREEEESLAQSSASEAPCRRERIVGEMQMSAPSNTLTRARTQSHTHTHSALDFRDSLRYVRLCKSRQHPYVGVQFTGSCGSRNSPLQKHVHINKFINNTQRSRASSRA